MDIAPVYELQTRLRSAAIAGVSLLQEDFRLKRAAEAMKPLEGASPVFAKIGQQMGKLLAADCENLPGTLLDTISLVDAVVCTLGTVGVKGDIESVGGGEIGNDTGVIINAPYSTLKTLLDALTTSGNGHYSFVCDTHESNPELFGDYRVRAAMVKALGASYTELADQAELWLKESGTAVVPLLMKGFDPKGKKEMVRRVRVIEAVAGAKANGFYIQMLDSAEKEVRQELIHALRFEKSNADLAMGMLKSEKGKSKQVCMRVLVTIGYGEAIEVLRKQAEKKPQEVAEQLMYSDSANALALLAEILQRGIEDLLAIDVKTVPREDRQVCVNLYSSAMAASIGKCTDAIFGCYQKIYENRKKLTEVLGSGVAYQSQLLTPAVFGYYFTGFNQKQTNQDRTRICEDGLAFTLQQSYMLNPDDRLKALIMELYEKSRSTGFLSAAITAKLLGGEGCEGWLDKEVSQKGLLKVYFPKESKIALKQALPYIGWDEDRCSYAVKAYRRDSLFDSQSTYVRCFEFPMRDKVSEILMGCGDETFDRIMAYWCGKNADRAYCMKLGQRYYNFAMAIANNDAYIGYLRRCGWTDCKGIGVNHMMLKKNDLHTWGIFYYIKGLPCDDTTKIEEIKAICGMLRSGELAAKNVNADELENMIGNL